MNNNVCTTLGTKSNCAQTGAVGKSRYVVQIRQLITLAINQKKQAILSKTMFLSAL